MSRRTALAGPAGGALAALLLAAGCGEPPVPGDEVRGEAYRLRNLGLARLEEGQPETAAETFRRLAALAPGEPLAHANLGLALLRAGRLEEAAESLGRARELAPHDPEVRHLLALLHQAAGRREEAIRVLEGTLERAGADLRTLYTLSDLLAEDPGAGPRRREVLERAVAASPGSLPLRLRLIEALLEAGEAPGAAPHLEAVLGLLGQPAVEVREAYDGALRHARDGGAEEALDAARGLHNLLRPSPAYQAGIIGLAGFGPAFVGFPLLAFRGALGRAEAVGAAGAAASSAVRFTEVTPGAFPGRSGEGLVPLLALDVDADGRDELLVADAGGGLRLLRHEAGRYAAVASDGLEGAGRAVAAAGGDVNDDGWMDVAVATPDGRVRVLLGGEGERWRVAARLAGPAAPNLLLADLDHDGDLDLLATGDGPDGSGAGGPDGIRWYRNDGPAGFAPAELLEGSRGPEGRIAATDFGDLDDDGDLDLVTAGVEGVWLLDNLRHGRLGARPLAPPPAWSGPWTTAAAGDLDHDGDLDVVAAGPGRAVLFSGRGDGSFAPRTDDRLGEAVAELELRRLLLLDADNDGHLDLAAAGRTEEGNALRLLRGRGDGTFEPASGWLSDPVPGPIDRLLAADPDGDGDLDLVVGGPSGSRLLRNDGGNANHWLRVRLVGLGAGSGKVNRLGIGSRVELRAGPLYQLRTVYRDVTHFGLGARDRADVLRVVWTNGVPQNELEPRANHLLVEEQTLKGSCAFLYAWDGEGYRFVTDIMWRSAIGMPLGIMGGSTAWAPPDASREHVRLPPGALVERDGRLSLRITEELWEVAYVDELRLVALDHPDSVELVLDERFVPSDVPYFELHQMADARPPVAAADSEGRDLLPGLLSRDDEYVPDVEPLARQGFVRPHDLVLDLGPWSPGERLRLFLQGWVYPADASINVAAARSGEPRPEPPRLEAPATGGGWVPVADVGFPAGKDKTVAVELTGRLPPGTHTVRLRTGMRVHWDVARVARGDPRAPLRRTELSPAGSELRYRGFSHEYRKGGERGPHWFDYDRVTTRPRWRPIPGAYTRYGDVLPLLDSTDDLAVVMAPGDELAVEFDAATLPPLPPGWSRTFLLYSVGWIKDADLNTAEGGTVEPLPFHAMTRYPPAPGEAYPTTAAHRRYLAEWQTRRVEGSFPLAAEP